MTLIGPERITTREELAAALTALREHAGLSVRDVARAAGVPVATVGGYFSGRHVPPASAAEQLRCILTACGVTERDRALAWLEAVRRVRRVPGRRAADAPVPYRGLASYQPDDAEWFFGREQLVDSLVARVLRPKVQAPVVVVGPSGSGKSSLVRAGLLPALRSRGWRVALLGPGTRPMAALESALAGAGEQTGADSGLLVIVDPFEELFTVGGAGERAEFLRALVQLARVADPAADPVTPAADPVTPAADPVTPAVSLPGRHGPVRVVLALRADFYAEAVRSSVLLPALAHNQVVVGPMNLEELRRVITEPAQRAGIDVEDGLVDVLLRDLAPRSGTEASAHEPGALPLLSHALLATWERGSQRRLTVVDYQAIGGIDGAVARTAESVYSGLDPVSQKLTRQLLLRLVHVVDGAPVARRQVPREEIEGSLTPSSADLLERFLDARLVTTDAQTVEIAHEALVWAWPRLRTWVAADQDGLRVRRLLTDSAGLWRDHDRDPHLLHRGVPLESAEEWAKDPAHASLLTPLEREFLRASISHAAALREAERRRAGRLRTLTVALSALLLLVSGLAVFSYQQARAVASQRDLAVSRELAMNADRLRGTNLALARQLALAAYKVSPTPEARSSLLSTSGEPLVTPVAGASGVLQAVALSTDGRLMATGGTDSRVRLYRLDDPSTPSLLGVLTGPEGTVFTVALSGANLLAASGADHLVHLWSLTDPAHPTPRPALTGAGSTVYSLTYSPDGRLLAGASADGRVYAWAPGSGSPEPVASARVANAAVQTVAFSPDGRVIAAAGADGKVHLLAVGSGTLTPLGAPLETRARVVYALAFSPAGSLLAAGTADGAVRLWDVTDPRHPVPSGSGLAGPRNWVNSLSFSSDGRLLAAGSSDNQVWVWDMRTRGVLDTLPHPGPVTGVAFRARSGVIVSTDTDGLARLWRVPGPLLGGAGSSIFSLAYSPNGSLLAAAGSTIRLWRVHEGVGSGPVGPPIAAPRGHAKLSGTVAISADGRVLATGAADGAVYLWSIATPEAPRLLATLTGPKALIESVALSKSSHLLAAGSDDSTVWLWDVADPAHPSLVADLRGPGGYVNSVAFSPDGSTLAAGSVDEKVWLWSLRVPAHPVLLGKPLAGPTSYVYGVAFSPDGRILAAGGDDHTVWLWDLSVRAHPVAFGPPLQGPGSFVYAVAFSPDGTLLAGVSGGGTVWLWDVHSPRRPLWRARLAGPEGALFAVAFASGGHTLATAGADRAVRLFDTDPTSVTRAVCTTSGPAITAQQWVRFAPDVPYAPPCPSRGAGTG